MLLTIGAWRWRHFIIICKAEPPYQRSTWIFCGDGIPLSNSRTYSQLLTVARLVSWATATGVILRLNY